MGLPFSQFSPTPSSRRLPVTPQFFGHMANHDIIHFNVRLPRRIRRTRRRRKFSRELPRHRQETIGVFGNPSRLTKNDTLVPFFGRCNLHKRVFRLTLYAATTECNLPVAALLTYYQTTNTTSIGVPSNSNIRQRILQ